MKTTQRFLWLSRTGLGLDAGNPCSESSCSNFPSCNISLRGSEFNRVRILVGSPEIGVTNVPGDSDITLTATCIRWRGAWHLACLLLTTTAQVERWKMTIISQVSLSKAGIFKEAPQNRSVIESMSSPTSGLAALMASLGYLPDPDIPTGYLKSLMHIPLPLCGVFRLPFRVFLGARACHLTYLGLSGAHFPGTGFLLLSSHVPTAA